MLETFLAALGVVFTMLIYAVPGFLLVKTKIIKENNISAADARMILRASVGLEDKEEWFKENLK